MSASGIGGTGDPFTSCWECRGTGAVIARDERGRFVSLADTWLAYTLMQDAWAIEQPMSLDAALRHIRGAS